MIIVLSILISIIIGACIFLFTQYLCIPNCNSCGVSDNCGGTCNCNTGQICTEGVCTTPIKENMTINCANESEKYDDVLPCCKNLIPYTDGLCHTWPYEYPGIDINKNKINIKCTPSGTDMAEQGLCAPCCPGTTSYLLSSNACTNNASYKYYCFSPKDAKEKSSTNLSKSTFTGCLTYDTSMSS